MLVGSILTFARKAAQTDINGLGDDVGVTFASEALMDFHRRLANNRVDAGGVYEASITGIVGTGIFNYPSNPCSTLALKTLELNYTSTSNNDYVVAKQVDVANLPGTTSFSWLRNNADPKNPLFDDRGDRFEVFPTPTSAHNVTAMARLFFYGQPSVYSAVANTVNYPENLDEAILGYRVAANYKYALQGEDNYVAGDKLMSKYEERVSQFINTLGQGSQQPLQAVPIQLSGWEF